MLDRPLSDLPTTDRPRQAPPAPNPPRRVTRPNKALLGPWHGRLVHGPGRCPRLPTHRLRQTSIPACPNHPGPIASGHRLASQPVPTRARPLGMYRTFAPPERSRARDLWLARGDTAAHLTSRVRVGRVASPRPHRWAAPSVAQRSRCQRWSGPSLSRRSAHAGRDPDGLKAIMRPRRSA